MLPEEEQNVPVRMNKELGWQFKFTEISDEQDTGRFSAIVKK